MYTVQPGDHLFRIALGYGLSTAAVQAANGIDNPDMIYVGQVLCIPSGGNPQTGAASFAPAQTQPGLSRLVIGCRDFLVTAASYVVSSSSQFIVTVTDSSGQVVYSRNGGITPGRYGGYAAPFSSSPASGPVHVVISLNGQTRVDVAGDYPAQEACAMFNWRNDAGFTDGRLNLADPWQSVAVYCYGDGSLSVLVPRYPGDLNSEEVLRVTQRQLARYPQKPAQDLLVASNHGVQLYIQSSGGLKIVAPTREPDKLYYFTWGGC